VGHNPISDDAKVSHVRGNALANGVSAQYPTLILQKSSLLKMLLEDVTNCGWSNAYQTTMNHNPHHP
jgi:hypothetical protein